MPGAEGFTALLVRDITARAILGSRMLRVRSYETRPRANSGGKLRCRFQLRLKKSPDTTERGIEDRVKWAA
jgi:hypothetical protein